MKISHVFLAFSFILPSSIVFAADSCSPQAQHQAKYEKFLIDDVPSLLEACGLGLSIKLPSFSIPTIGDLFCGYSAGDLNDWYKSNYRTAPSPSSASRLSMANTQAINSFRAPSSSPSSSAQTRTYQQADSSNEQVIQELEQISGGSSLSTTVEQPQPKTPAKESSWEPASLFKK